MRRAILPLTVLLVVQVALAALLAVRRDPLAGMKIDTPLVQPSVVKSTDQLVIESHEAKPATGAANAAAAGAATAAAAGAGSEIARIELTKKDGAWVLPGQFDAPADNARVNALLDRLGALKRGLPIATSDAALRRFKLVATDFERRVLLNAGGKTLDTLYFGTSSGLRKSDARTDADRAVYAVDLPSYELPTDPGAWLNADLLRNDAERLTELDVGSGPGDKLQLLKKKGADKQPDSWSDPAMAGDKHVDSAHAEALAQQLSQVHVDAVLGTASKPEWQQEHPALTLELKDDKAHSVDWTLSKPVSGDFYVLKSSAHPWYFSVSSTLGKELIDAGAREALIAGPKPAEKPAIKPAAKLSAKPIGKS